MKSKLVDLNRSLRAKFKDMNHVEVVVVDHNSGMTYVWTLSYDVTTKPVCVKSKTDTVAQSVQAKTEVKTTDFASSDTDEEIELECISSDAEDEEGDDQDD